MAFLNKILKKTKADKEVEDDDEQMDWDLPGDSESDSDDEEAASDPRSSGMKLEDESDDSEAGPEDEMSEDSTDDPSESSEEDQAEGSKKTIATASLMDIFEEELAVDLRLSSMASTVEEVSAQELVSELRSLENHLRSL